VHVEERSCDVLHQSRPRSESNRSLAYKRISLQPFGTHRAHYEHRLDVRVDVVTVRRCARLGAGSNIGHARCQTVFSRLLNTVRYSCSQTSSAAVCVLIFLPYRSSKLCDLLLLGLNILILRICVSAGFHYCLIIRRGQHVSFHRWHVLLIESNFCLLLNLFCASYQSLATSHYTVEQWSHTVLKRGMSEVSSLMMLQCHIWATVHQHTGSMRPMLLLLLPLWRHAEDIWLCINDRATTTTTTGGKLDAGNWLIFNITRNKRTCHNRNGKVYTHIQW